MQQRARKQGKPSPEVAEKKTEKERTKTSHRKRVRTGGEEHAHAQTHGTPAWCPLTQKGLCWRPHETALVHRLSPQSEDGRYGKPDALVTGSTHAIHRSARSPRPKPEQPARDKLIAGPKTGTTRSNPCSGGASGRPKEPGSRPASTCPAQLPSKSGGSSPQDGERHHRCTESDWTGRGAAHQLAATRHTREACRWPQPTEQVPSNNFQRVQQGPAARTRRNEPRHRNRCQATPNRHIARPSQEWRGTSGGRTQADTHPDRPASSGRGSRDPSPPTDIHTAYPSKDWRGTSRARTRTHTDSNTPARSGGAHRKPEPKHTHAHRTPQPRVAGYKQSAHTHNPTPQRGLAGRSRSRSPSAPGHTAHPSQVSRSTSGGRTHTPTPQPGVAGGSRNLSPSRHTHTAHTSQEWRGTSRPHKRTPEHPSQDWRVAAEARGQGHPPTPRRQARSGGVQADRAHKHKDTPTPRPRVAGRIRNPSPSTHTHAAQANQEWQGTSGARTQADTRPNGPARSGGAQPKPEPKHTHPRCTPQPGVAGHKRREHRNMHTPTSQPGVAGCS